MTYRTKVLLMALLALTVAPLGLAAAEDLPSAEKVIAKYVDAIGGEAAIGKIKNRVTKGAFSLPAMGMEATIESYIEPPNMYTKIDLESMGMTIETGVTDGVAWQLNPMQGSSIMEGVEKAGALRQLDFNEYANWKKHYSKLEVTGEEDVAGDACYVVVATPNEGDDITLYFSKESGLLIQSKAVAQGFPVTSTISDYLEVDGVKIASKVSSSGGQMDVEITIESVEHNVEMPEGRFDLPDEIKALLAGPDSTDESSDSADESSDSADES